MRSASIATVETLSNTLKQIKFPTPASTMTLARSTKCMNIVLSACVTFYYIMLLLGLQYRHSFFHYCMTLVSVSVCLLSRHFTLPEDVMTGTAIVPHIVNWLNTPTCPRPNRPVTPRVDYRHPFSWAFQRHLRLLLCLEAEFHHLPQTHQSRTHKRF